MSDNYHQHNPQIADGLSGLDKALEAMAKAGVSMKYELNTSRGTLAQQLH
jgi:predicted SnoaL-like aldol condensation-catalyzing enzyme